MSNITLKVNGSDDQKAGFITWTPAPLLIENSDESSLKLTLSCRSLNGSISKVEFYNDLGDAPTDEIRIELEAATTKELFVAGKFQEGKLHSGASPDGKDISIEVKDEESGEVLASLNVMIRVRKNANFLSETARDDFLKALASLNGIAVDEDSATPGAGKGIYVTDFVEMHVSGASGSEHGDSHFLPWHRLYLLDLERKLQEINPAVTMPYWKFDKVAPNIFHEDFMGETSQIPRDTRDPRGRPDSGPNTPLVKFSSGNHLSKWQIKEKNGIPRAVRFDPIHEPANGAIFYSRGRRIDFQVLSEEDTLALGGGITNPADAEFGDDGNGFSGMEGTPHGAAHVSFNGYISDVPVAPQDPLFFFLHCNVDRLWARWQLTFDRDNSNEIKTYPYQNAGDAGPWKIINSKQWPWVDGVSVPGSLRPPGTRMENFTKSTTGLNFPNNVPAIKDSIDPFANRATSHFLGFAYDDIPFNPVTDTIV